MKGKKVVICSELVYLAAILILSFSVAMITSTDFGVSMIVAPAYILSQKFTFFTFGQCEYIVQGLLFIVFCILMKKVKIVYFSSFITCLIYGAVLDIWRFIVPLFNPDITVPGSMPMYIRIILFAVGMLMTSFSVALFYRTYLYPQVYDFFVKGISAKYGFNRTRFKMLFDLLCLITAIIMTLILFRGFVGIGVGTIIMTCLNGVFIGLFGRFLDNHFEFVPVAKRFSSCFNFK
ncbi:MAG: DUF6198 family protein [Oscillospiraceae bacterium]